MGGPLVPFGGHPHARPPHGPRSRRCRRVTEPVGGAAARLRAGRTGGPDLGRLLRSRRRADRADPRRTARRPDLHRGRPAAPRREVRTEFEGNVTNLLADPVVQGFVVNARDVKNRREAETSAPPERDGACPRRAGVTGRDPHARPARSGARLERRVRADVRLDRSRRRRRPRRRSRRRPSTCKGSWRA